MAINEQSILMRHTRKQSCFLMHFKMRPDNSKDFINIAICLYTMAFILIIVTSHYINRVAKARF
ncbi:hypothetical protein HA41_05535 [Pantoea conspicua]|uniref:Uncharacterized protein n=1 Tax=Pantoea conspicua TaxID=472705 RepID=A0A1X1BZN6_9GAMM|nr:hypothetical protein HA41_05535 [Pantoea conspicua]